MKKITLYLIALSFIQCNAIQKALSISIPKCGTHLMLNTLDYLLKNDYQDWPTDQFALLENDINTMQTSIMPGHFIYNKHNQKKAEQFSRIFLVIRDPRDQCVSMMYWLHKHPMGLRLIQGINNDTVLYRLIENPFSLYTDDIRNNHPEFKREGSIADFYALYLPWLDDNRTKIIKFEHLVGSYGGGSKKLQNKTIDTIIDHIDIEKESVDLKFIAYYIFGHSNTFRKGVIGSWKTHFTERHKIIFKKVAGDLLIKLGYEKDYNW